MGNAFGGMAGERQPPLGDDDDLERVDDPADDDLPTTATADSGLGDRPSMEYVLPYSPRNELGHLMDSAYAGLTADPDSLFTSANTPTFISFLTFCFASGAFVSVLTPFLPLELAKCGGSELDIGLVFSAYPAANLLAVPLATWLCARVGRGAAFVIGAVLEASLGILLGYAHLMLPKASLPASYLLIRIGQGVGASNAYTALMAWASLRFRRRLAAVLGIQEAVYGIAFMLGPPIGGILYRVGGMALPMVLFGVLVLASLPGVFLSMTGIQGLGEEEGEGEGDAGEGAGGGGGDLAVSDLVNLSTVNSSVVTIVAAIGFSFIYPVAAPHFQKVLKPEITPVGIGLLLCIPAFLYAILSPVSGMVSERCGFKRVMFVGMVTLSASYFLLGPFQVLEDLLSIEPFTREMWMCQVLALVLLGVGAAFAFVPALPDMQKSVDRFGPRASEAIAGYFNGIYQMGEAIGPLVAGLVQVLPFHTVCSIVAGAHLAYVGVVLFWRNTRRLCQTAIRDSRKGSLSARQTPERRASIKEPLLGE